MHSYTHLQSLIEQTYDQKSDLSTETLSAVESTLQSLNSGKLRVCEKVNDTWVTHDWIKKAILLYFKSQKNQLLIDTQTHYFDKIPAKFLSYDAKNFSQEQLRAVPGSYVRKGAYIGPKTVLMPSFVNIGAYIDSGCMIDTWATVGSCAQIGKNVHISGGAGIGGVLEPIQAAPTIIEDDCFIGARCEVVEGVIIEEGSVLATGVTLSQSTKIYDREKDKIYYGRVPQGSVVVPGSLPDHQSKAHLYAAIIVKRVDKQTRQKLSLNEILRP
ncbi:MAG TPA: 2,3,4,5-tetrahydropyridine-2,6-dicarboxylate N-succinyltransferase [Gammaproteobacteria bacterium]|nr:2,3,4,5-tetrahydropyridine-2,6-dicarboxylate N-succinyltransferase [Gammaproteobacteria bacterium]